MGAGERLRLSIIPLMTWNVSFHLLQRTKERVLMFKHYLIISVVLVVFFLPLTVLGRMVSVSGEEVNLRSGPGTNYSVKWKYGSGLPLKVLKKQGSWVKVEDFENDTGWLHTSLVSDTGHMIVKVNKDKNKKVD